MLRAILLRFAIPTLVAVSMLAYFGVPYADRMLADWFRDDIDLRAQLVANSMAESVSALIDKDDERQLRRYLAGISNDERLLAVVLCRENGSLIYKSDRTPDAITCTSMRSLVDRENRLLQLPSGSVEVSTFAYKTAGEIAFRALVVHDL